MIQKPFYDTLIQKEPKIRQKASNAIKSFIFTYLQK